MTKTNILEIIKENNVNKEITWNITKNTKSEVIITNNYDDNIEFSIVIEEVGINLYDNLENKMFSYLIKGTSIYDDYSYDEVGLSMAIKKVVRHFYNVY